MVLSKSKLLNSFVDRVNFGHLGFCNAHLNLGIQALLLRFARIEMLSPQQVLETHPRPQQRNAIKPESYRGDFFSFFLFSLLSLGYQGRVAVGVTLSVS